MTPEEKARIKIDQWFADAGWKVVNREDYEPTCTAVAIREGLLKGNLEADYFLFINGKAVGVLEAKREETDAFASKVCEQAALYARSVPNIYQAYQKPLPFIFTSNGKELYCCDFREQDSCFRQIMNIPTPHELVKRLGIEDAFAGLPTLKKKGLRDCQYEAVTELEKSFRAGQNRALMVLATGVGKTYTACLAAYRMLSYTPMRRVLFLVDRNNLGKQVEGEFGTFRLTENGDAFNTIFTVNRLRSSSIPSDSNVVISTIQRLFSFLKGETIEDNDDDENEIIGMEKYISFIADTKGWLYESLSDTINNEFNEYGAMEEPTISKRFNGSEISTANLDFEKRLFGLLNDLSGILYEYKTIEK